MTTKQYVNAITRKIKCPSGKKKEIKKQLLADIGLRMEQGENAEDILARMGSVKEIAESFNENISMEERKKFVRNKILKIVISVALLLLLLAGLIYWMMPKFKSLGNDGGVSESQVEELMKETVVLLDEGDYASLQAMAVSQMVTFLNEETVNAARLQISDNWGERTRFGTAYITEVTQGNTKYRVGEITVSYENVNIIYTLTYDDEMKLAGLYMR